MVSCKCYAVMLESKLRLSKISLLCLLYIPRWREHDRTHTHTPHVAAATSSLPSMHLCCRAPHRAPHGGRRSSRGRRRWWASFFVTTKHKNKKYFSFNKEKCWKQSGRKSAKMQFRVCRTESMQVDLSLYIQWVQWPSKSCGTAWLRILPLSCAISWRNSLWATGR